MLRTPLRDVGGSCTDDGGETQLGSTRPAWGCRRIVAFSIVFFMGVALGLFAAWAGGGASGRQMTHRSSQQLESRTSGDVPASFNNDVLLLETDESVDLDESSPSMWSDVKKFFTSLWHAWNKLYFAFWETQIEESCHARNVTNSCCKEIIHVTSEVRFSIYLAVFFAFLFGALVIRWAYKIGTNMKPLTPTYWTSKSCSLHFDDCFRSEVDVTSTLRSTVQELLDLTTDPRRMGKGMDGAWVKHKKFRVVKVVRIENGKLWTAYQHGKKAMRKVRESMGGMTQTNEELTQQAQEILDKSYRLWSRSKAVYKWVKSLSLDESRNEVILFHGCPGVGARDVQTGEVKFEEGTTSPLQAVKEEGFDDRLGSIQGMLGSGIYFADMASKADQYAGKYGLPDETTVGEEASMFLARVALGCPYLTDQSLEQMRRPPCIRGHFDLNLSWNNQVRFGKPWKEKNVLLEMCEHPRYDSVISGRQIDGGYKLYHEYAIFGRQCYPEFCVTYIREE